MTEKPSAQAEVSGYAVGLRAHGYIAEAELIERIRELEAERAKLLQQWRKSMSERDPMDDPMDDAAYRNDETLQRGTSTDYLEEQRDNLKTALQAVLAREAATIKRYDDRLDVQDKIIDDLGNTNTDRSARLVAAEALVQRQAREIERLVVIAAAEHVRKNTAASLLVAMRAVLKQHIIVFSEHLDAQLCTLCNKGAVDAGNIRHELACPLSTAPSPFDWKALAGELAAAADAWDKDLNEDCDGDHIEGIHRDRVRAAVDLARAARLLPKGGE